MKSKKMLALVLAITIFSVKLTIGQNYHKDVVPPDPVSAQFQKYLGYPVSTATGIPEINIPLYTMETDGVSIPFSLSYHASGIGVKQPTGLVGLGWSLFPGFKITRTIMGNPDDRCPTNDIRYASQADFDYLWGITPHNLEDENYAGAAHHDGQYDIFSVHLPNLNATFILEWVSGELKATTIPQSSLAIRVTGLTSIGEFLSFEITDENGVVYKFGSSSENLEYTASSFITSWMLTEIDPPGSNNFARFFYQESSANIAITIDESLLIDDSMNTAHSSCYKEDMQMGYWDFPYGYTTPPHIADFYKTKSVSSIEFDTGESIVFDYSENWIYDALDKITFKNHEGNAVKTVQFERANQQLTKLLISGENAYEFFYDQQVIANPQAQDFLGLYNGKPNSSLIPKIVFDKGNSACEYGDVDYITGVADRSFDPVKSQARILKNIIYPTGGQTSFEYEPNSYQTDEGVSCGMGLRIKRINTFDPISNKTMTKSYKYGQNESGVGHLTMDFLKRKNGFIDAYINQRWILNATGIMLEPQSYRESTLGSQSRYSSFEPNVWYDEVTEYNNNEGKTIFNYEYTPTYYNIYHYSTYEHYFDTNRGINSLSEYYPQVLRGLGVSPRLTYKTVKDINDTVLERTEYQYSNDKRQLTGLMSIATKYFFLDGNKTPYNTTHPQYINANNYYNLKETIFSADNYGLEINNDKLISTIQTNYNQGNPITTETSFVYDNTNKFNLKSKSVKTSTGDVLTEKYYYPVGDAIPDLGTMTGAQQAMVATLASNNYRTTIIEKETLRNNVSISKELFGYKNWGNSILKPEQIYAKKEGNNFDSRYFYYGYDDKGNVLEVSQANKSHTFYVWGYNKRYPVAKMENFETSQITPAIQTAIDAVVNASNADHDRTMGTAGQEGMLRAALATLRDLLPNSMVAAFTYDPLVGVTSTTDPKGNTNYYDYDSYYKLKGVKDSGGNYLVDYKYNYVPMGTYSPIAVPDYSGDLYCGGGQTYIERPTYSVDNEYLEFGDAPVGSSSFLNFNITNTTPLMYQTRYININSIDLPSGFSLVSGLPASLDRGEFATVTVAFNPDAVTGYWGTATINAEAASLEYIEATGPYIIFSGNGVPGSTNSKIIDMRYNGSSINSLDFGTVNGYDEAVRTIQVYNTGNTTLNVTSIVSSDSSIFTLLSGFNSATIPAGGYISFEVDFHNIGSSESGLRTGTITINSDRTGGNNILSVSGTLVP